MWVHFLHRHVLDTVIILDKVNLPPPMVRLMRHAVPLVVPERQAPCHSPVCQGSGAEEAEACGGRDEGEFGAGLRGIWEPLKNFSTFRYLGRVLMAVDDDWLAVVGNLGKAWKSWGRLSQILIRDGAYPKVSGIFTNRWYRRCCCLGWGGGSSLRGCSGPWTVSNIGLQGGSPGNSRGDGQMGAGNTRLGRRHWGKQVLRV